MIKCVIIDDEPLAIDLLKDYVSKAEGFELVGTFANPIEALQQVETLDVDLIFLDVQMPELNGIQFLKIKKGKCHFVMTTAYQKYAIEGFEHDVIDYLLKPISIDRFMISMERVKARLADKAVPEVVKKAETIPEYIFVKSEYKTLKINIREIKYLEGMSDYVSIHLPDKRVMTLDSLKNFITKLPSQQFIRVHKSFVVNIEQIDHVERNQIIISDKRIPIGATYLKGFKDLLNI